jgi:ornithine cyclodeaminase/alanine dehydrogenase-like protein (mu-crystallin family)
LLTQADLRPLVEDRSHLEGAFQAIEAAVLEQAHGRGGHVGQVTLPFGEEGVFTVYSTAAAPGAAVRIFPAVGGLAAADMQLMVLIDYATGRIRALLAGDDLNVLRTSVPAGVGAKYLAPESTRVLCILGSGEQASSHICTFRHALPALERVLVWSPTAANRQRFAEEWSARLGLPVEAVDSAEAAVREADVITATGNTRGRPALEGAWVRPGALLVTMTRAAPPDLVERARLFFPSKVRPVALTAPPGAGRPGSAAPGGPPGGGPGGPGAGPGGAPPPGPRPLEAYPHEQLADVMEGKAPARERPDQTVVYELGAMYGWDVPIIQWALDWATRRGVGTEIKLSS